MLFGAQRHLLSGGTGRGRRYDQHRAVSPQPT